MWYASAGRACHWPWLRQPRGQGDVHVAGAVGSSRSAEARWRLVSEGLLRRRPFAFHGGGWGLVMWSGGRCEEVADEREECDGGRSEAGRSKIDAQGLPHRAQAWISSRSMSTKHWQTHGANAPKPCPSDHWLLGIPARTSSRARLTSPLVAPCTTPLPCARDSACTTSLFLSPQFISTCLI